MAFAVAIVGIGTGLGLGLETAWTADYAGSAICKSCHAVHTAAWERSDHFRAMQPASTATVAGDFADVRVTFHGMDTRFFRDGDDHFVETVGPAGDRGEFPVRYAFGYRPLQQYLLDRGDGILQAFDVAWDSRPAPDGQRWFHLQPDEPMAPEHPFFWTGHAMNWSSHCADCHSTNVVKNLDATTGRFRTDYAEANVACEACHGPGDKHVRLAQAGTLAESIHSGFGVGLGESVQWRFVPDNPIAEPYGNHTDRDIDMCGGCHSLRTPLVTDPVGRTYHEAYRLELPDDVRYFPDGQIREEVFVLGSFLQSKMHVRGVTCGNCHEPHSGELLLPGNGVCAQCHRADVYDVASHHRHPAGQPGSACVDCHMPARTYMGVDDRRDHSFPIPRPALSAQLGVPNACVDCHQGEDNRWAVESLRRWGIEADGSHWGLVHRRLRQGDPGALPAVKSLLEDRDLAPLVKASLLAQTANVGTRSLIEALKPWLADPDPLIRRGAVAGTTGLPGDVRWWMLADRLNEAHPGVRFDLAGALAGTPGLSPAARRAATPLLDGFREALTASADLAASQTAVARLELHLGQTQAAERAFERALEIDPASVPALVDLADLRRGQGREQAAGTLLRQALAAAPDSGTAHVAYGLHLVRLKRHDDALVPLAKATRTADAQPRFFHIYAVAQDSLGHRDQALVTLRRGVERWPWDVDLLSTLVMFADDGKSPEVRQHLDTLARIAPDSSRVRALVDQYGPGRNP